MSVRLYEAVVTEAAPSGEPAGFITVRCDELLFGQNLPVSVGPLFPGWTGGGWQSSPLPASPDGGDSRVIIIELATETYRWLGTSEEWSWITDGKGKRAGMRSSDGKRVIQVDDDSGVLISIDSGPSIELKNGNQVLIKTNAGMTIDIGASLMTTYKTSSAVAYAALTDGLPVNSFHIKLASALTELMALPAAFGVPTTNTAAFIALLAASSYKSTTTKVE
jgi:hypothetical protein